MNDTLTLPATYAEWRHCITVSCGIRLTRTYAEQRLDAMRDLNDAQTRRFIELYGREHHERVVNWFYKAHME